MNRVALLVVLVLSAAPSRAASVEQLSADSNAKFVRLMDAFGNKPDNLGRLPGGVFRGADLVRSERYYYLKRILGVGVVINLTQNADDHEACRENELDCEQFPIPLYWPFHVNMDWGMLRRAFRRVIDARRRGERVYFHCEAGADRTGALAAALAVRRAACGRKFDKNVLWAEVDADLTQHRFHEKFFPQLHKQIRSLVYDFKANERWLCR